MSRHSRRAFIATGFSALATLLASSAVARAHAPAGKSLDEIRAAIDAKFG
jgi:hypothetical protein